MSNVAPVHAALEPDGRHALIGRQQSRLEGRSDSRDGQDPAAAGDHAPFFQSSAGVENLQPHVLNQRQTCGTDAP